ncbi:MAG: hypothetical protein C0432_05015 [Candidatus Puniceispirillum sp.]|nr:hypothetical protein [Candidatus Pelagibacter sp.]MBA4283635.1 hypothetical protein [Candidatus Puniceispirillum sp.]
MCGLENLMSNFINQFVKHPNFFQIICLSIILLTCLVYTAHALNDVLDPFILSFILSYFIDKGISKAEHRLSRTYLSLLFILLITGLFIVSILVIFPYLKTQFNTAILEIPRITEKTYQNIQRQIEHPRSAFLHQTEFKSYILNTLPKIMDHLSVWLSETVSYFLSNSLEIANKLSIVFFTPILTFYISKDWPKIQKFLKNGIPSSIKIQSLVILSEIDLKITNYLKGQTIICAYLTIIYVTLLSIIGLKNSMAIGFATGILSFIPYFGFIVGFISSLAVSFFYFSGWWQIIGIVSIFNIVALIEMNYLLPKFIGNHLGVNPAWIIFSILATSQVLGFCWIALSIPILCIFKVLFTTIFSSHQNGILTPITPPNSL